MLKCRFYIHHGAKTEPNTSIRTNHIHLYVQIDADFYPLLIRAKTVFQRQISAKMRYEFHMAQNWDIDGGYMGGKRGILPFESKMHHFA